MDVFQTKKPVVDDKVFVLPVKRPTFTLSPTIQNKEKVLYPIVSGMTPEEVQVHSDAGIMGPVLTQTDIKTQQKQLDNVQEILEIADRKQSLTYGRTRQNCF